MTERLYDITLRTIGSERHRLAIVHNVLDDPNRVIDQASKADFVQSGLAYPGAVAPVEEATCVAVQAACRAAVDVIAPGAMARFERNVAFSIVTRGAFDAVERPIRPHTDATAPTALSAVLFLSPDIHGGVVFFRHQTLGFEAITQDRLVFYQRAIGWDTRRRKARTQVFDTAYDPGYTKIRNVPAEFNSMVVFPSYILHSDDINRAAPLPLDAHGGRLTAKTLFHRSRPVPDAGVVSGE